MFIYSKGVVIRIKMPLTAPESWDGTFDKIINWAIMNEKAHLYSPSFGARAECNINKVKGGLGSHGTARTGALGHSRVLWATAQLGMH